MAFGPCIEMLLDHVFIELLLAFVLSCFGPCIELLFCPCIELCSDLVLSCFRALF